MTPNDPLNLQAWKAGVDLPAHFQSEVWRRISARAVPRSSFPVGWVENLLLLFPRPAYAAALLTACIGLGLGLGLKAADHARAATSQAGRALYMASINPLGHVHSSLE